MHHRKITVFSLILLSVAAFYFMNFKNPDSQKEKLIQIAKEYKQYSLYNNGEDKWTIQMCAPHSQTTKIDDYHFSRTKATHSPHGDKLYKLFVKYINPYQDTMVKNQPLGQVLVKETWKVKEVNKDSAQLAGLSIKQSKNDGKWYTPTTVSELFIMYKEKTNNTNDQGWVYGIVNLEKPEKNAAVLSSGKISTCISCHQETKYDRMFGAR